MTEKFTVSKLDAARRQLESAIRLYFYDGDFISTHTLAAAAFNVLNDLCRKMKGDVKSIRDELLTHIRPEKQKWFGDQLRKTENFVKHADHDSVASHSFDPGITTIFMFDAVTCYWRITGEHTPLMQAYYGWYMMQNPDIFFLPKEYLVMLGTASDLMKNVTKTAFLEAIIPALLRRGHCST